MADQIEERIAALSFLHEQRDSGKMCHDEGCRYPSTRTFEDPGCRRCSAWRALGFNSPKEAMMGDEAASVSEALKDARERVARCAERDRQPNFAAEVRAGCWDHRSDVQAALRGEKLRGEP